MSQRGFTLAELVVSAALTLAVVALAVGVAGPARMAFDKGLAEADLAQRLRVGLEAISHDILAAGAGVALAETMPLPDSVPVIQPLASLDGAWAADRAFHAIGIITVPPLAAQAVLREPLSVLTGPLRLALPPSCPTAAPACGFSPSEVAIVFDDSGTFDMIGIDAVDPGGVSLTPHAALRVPYASGAAVAVVDGATYGLVADGAGGQRLVKLTRAGATLPVLDHVVAFVVEPFGEAAPPLPPSIEGVPPTYGPRPPPPGVDDERDSWGVGENCIMGRTAEGVLVPRLPWLGPAGTLVALSPEMLSDGPWCAGRGDTLDFDADLFRIRRLDLRLRVEVASAQLRGPAGRLFARPGQGTRSTAWVPDGELRLSITPRNLARR